MTGNQGNGALVQHSTGATTANDCAKFDANGNVVDAGAACGAGSGSGTVASFAAPPASWPAWLVPTVTNATTAPSLGVTAATLPHALLPTLLSADIPNNAASTAGNAATATALAATPAQCAGGQFATGIAASGAANCSTPATAAAPAAFAALTVTSNAATLATGGAAFANASLALNHGAATTLNVSGLASGASFNVVLTQDSSGGNTLVLGTGCTWYAGTNAGFVATTSPALSAAANGINLLSAIYDGAKCYYNVR